MLFLGMGQVKKEGSSATCMEWDKVRRKIAVHTWNGRGGKSNTSCKE